MEIRETIVELEWIQDRGRCHRAFDWKNLVRDVCGVEMAIEGSMSIVIRGFDHIPRRHARQDGGPRT